MESANCFKCGAPNPNASLMCAFCGQVLAAPKNVEEEMSLVRQQAEVASNIASDKGGFLGNLSQDTREKRLQGFWANAYMPQSTAGLLVALTTCVTSMPDFSHTPTTSSIQAGHAKELLMALCGRAEAIEIALQMKNDLTAEQRAVTCTNSFGPTET